MKKFTLFLYISIITAEKYPLKPDDGGLTTPEMIKNHGYPCEIHRFPTDDGFILEYHRVPHGIKNKNSHKKRPPLILMHGVGFSSVQDFGTGPKKGLGYIYADNGFDVWAANQRGNHFSRNHTRLDWVKDREKYFDFSFHEIGYYDIPAAMDYIRNVTGYEKVFYSGNSMGGTIFLTFAALRPVYLKRIQLAVLFSPAGYVRLNTPFGRFLKDNYKTISMMVTRGKSGCMGPFTSLRNAWHELTTNRGALELVLMIFTELFTNRYDAEAMIPYFGAYFKNMPSEFPIKHFEHYSQLAISGNFQQYDYGRKKNLERYGSINPPHYNISAINCPIALYYAKADYLIHYDQQLRLQRELPNIVHNYLESTGRYNHISFGGAHDVAELVYSDVIRFVTKYM